MESMPRPERGQQDGPPDFTQMREQMQKMQEESRKVIESVLTADQLTKYDVMVFQQSGGLDSPMINVNSLRALSLTDDQKAKIEAAQEKVRAAMQGFDFRNASEEERNAQMEKMRAAREEFQATLKSILTADQLAKAEELMNDVPEYLQQRRGGPGGPGGRQGGGLDGWQPGQGPRGENPNREQRGNRGGSREGGRQFPN